MSKIQDVYYVSSDDEQIKPNPVSRTPNNDLSKDAFMQLLVTQLRYQDPLNPMDNQAFMAQMAQFSALEHMMNMNNSMDRANAHNLIGKVVEATYKDPATNNVEVILGKVDSVVTKNGKHFLLVDGKEVEMKDVQSVIDPSLIKETEINSGFELIGKTVQATLFDKELKMDIIYEGEVQEIIMIDGKSYISMGKNNDNIKIPVENVKNIIDKPTITGKTAKANTKDENGVDIVVEGIVDYILVIEDEINVAINGYIIPFKNIETVSK